MKPACPSSGCKATFRAWGLDGLRETTRKPSTWSLKWVNDNDQPFVQGQKETPGTLTWERRAPKKIRFSRSDSLDEQCRGYPKSTWMRLKMKHLGLQQVLVHVSTYQGKPFWGYPVFEPQPLGSVCNHNGPLVRYSVGL